MAGTKAVTPDEEIVIITEGGKVLRSTAEEVRQTGRSASGVRMLNVDEGDRIAGLAVFVEKDDENGNGGGADEDADAPTPESTPEGDGA